MTPPEIDHKLLLKRSLLAIDDLKAKLAAFERAASEPIAVVGTGCRLPGGAETPEAFWEVLSTGTDTVTEVPPERWDVDKYYDPNPDTPGKSYSRWGAFLKNVDLFDADFFGVSPREAVSLDPQQRLLLEVTWEALENAGIAPSRLMGSQTSVHIGMSTHDYAHLFVEQGSFTQADAYMASGTTHSMASGRLAYVLGLHGPNIAMDTACSSSIVATHLGVQSLRKREADVAITAGVNLTISPNGGILTSRGRMASPTGRCHTFDASADGYVRGEGCVVLVLKRLSDAQRDGDRILALIRGSALNQDGRSSGLTAPFGPAQEAVIRSALNNAGLTPADISYVEAHGTGTSLGDPIEMKALGESYARVRTDDAPLMVGSVKTNIGHLEGAAGVAGLLKVILSLQHKALPPHLHFNVPNPLIPWDQYPITVPTKLTPWTVPGNQLRRAGASAFGFSGTNGHMILEEAPATQQVTLDVDRPKHILPLSAQTPESLTELANRYATYLERSDAASLADIASTAAMGRSHFVERAAVVASTNAEAREKLLAVAAGQLGPGIAKGYARGDVTPEVVFMCTGQGAQHPGMTRQLYDTQPTFKRTLDQCAELLDRELEQPLLSVLFPADPTDTRIHETAYTQPALFAVEYALAQLWRSWGIEPSLVLGHSVGEYVAACLAGVFTLEDALRLIAARGRLMGRLPRNGAMAAIFAEESRVASAIQSVRDRVSIAGVNGPQSIVISGETTAVDTILEQFTREGVEFQRLTVSHAFHSPLMDGILDEFEAVAATITFSAPTIGLISNVTGEMAGTEITTPSYWRRHLRDAVRFADSIATADREGYRIFLEIGPSPTLIGMARRCLPGDEPLWLPSLRKGVDDWTAMLETLGALYVNGCNVDWTGLERDYLAGRQRVSLPTYPFKRQRFWLNAGNLGEVASSRQHLTPLRAPHQLIDGKLDAASDIFETRISIAALPYLADHRIAGLVLFPATGYIELALAAARETLGTSSAAITDFAIREALVVPDNDSVTLQIVFAAANDGTTGFQIFSAQQTDDASTPATWKLHATGRVAAAAGHLEGDSKDDATRSIESLQAQCPTPFDVAGFYTMLESVGADYGPTFQGVREIRRGAYEALGHVQLPEGTSTEGTYIVHPALLDACLQLTGAALPGAEKTFGGSDIYVPVGIEKLHVIAPAGNEVWCHVTLPENAGQSDTITAELTLIAPTGQVAATLHGLKLKRIAPAALQRMLGARSHADWVYEIAWRPVSAPVQGSSANPGRWILVADETGVTASLADHLRTLGHSVDVVSATDRINTHSSNGASPLTGVVYLAAIDSASPLSLDTIRAAEQRILSGAYAVAQSCADSGARLWFVTRGSQPVAGSVPDVVQGPVWGLGGVVASEYPAMGCTRIDLDPAVEVGSPAAVQQLAALLLAPDAEEQIAIRAGTRYVARMVPSRLAPASDTPVRLEIHTRGQLDNLQLVPLKRVPPGPGQVEVRVYATGLNFRDVLNTLGMYPGDPGPLGSECAGVISAIGEGVTDLAIGDEVITMIDQSFASYALAPAVLTVPKPKHLSFAEAATIPVTFLTADYALNEIGRMKAGDRVLIHAATGGVGMAATQLARRAGAEIFGTAGSPAKRAMAQQLGAHHVADSRSVSFADDFRRVTGGPGIDIALNSLAGDFIPKTLELLRSGGRFIEIGKTDVWDKEKVAQVYPGLEYEVLYLGDKTAADPRSMRDRLLRLLKEFEAGHLKPLPPHIFPLDKSVDAFRFMAQAKHTGKIVITQQHGSPINSGGTYLITGGFGGLGLTVARWMAEEGAAHLVLMSRNASAESVDEIVEFEKMGVQVTVARGDVSSPDDVARIVKDIEASPFPLRGVMHVAGIVDDAMIPDQDWPSIERVLAPKVWGTWNLHTATLGLPLDFFVMFSSGAAIMGSPGQSNYAAANLFLDTMAHMRRAQGLPALSINWGSWSGVGMAANVSEQHRRRWAALGLGMIAPEEGMRAMHDLMLGARPPQMAVLPLTISKLKTTSPFYSELIRSVNTSKPAVSSAKTTATDNVHQRVSEVTSAERAPLVVAFLREQLVRVLALDPSYQVDPHRSIMEMGLDSLMAMELRNRIDTNLGVTVSVADLLLGPSVHALTDAILSRFVAKGGVSGDTPASTIDQAGDAELLAALDTMSEDDLDAQLARLLAESERASESDEAKTN